MAHSGCGEEFDFSSNEKNSVKIMLSILIINYNGKTFLGDCLKSISKLVSVQHELIVVDNGSTDGSCEYINEHFPNVRLIASDKNLGFAGGNNLGAQAAKGKYLLLLNNDTILLSDIKPAIELLDEHPDFGVVGGKMFDRNGEYRHSAGYFPSLFRIIKISCMYRKKGPFRKGDFPLESNSRTYSVDWVEASLLFTRLSLWHELGGLDAAYFMYGEDVDYCRRSRELGLLTSYCPDVKYIHYGGYTSDRFPLIIKGINRFHQKYSSFCKRTLVLAVLNAGLFIRVLVTWPLFIITKLPDHKAKIESCWSALKNK